MYKYCLQFIRGLRGVEEFIFYADSIELAKDHAKDICQDRDWQFVKVNRYYGTLG